MNDYNTEDKQQSIHLLETMPYSHLQIALLQRNVKTDSQQALKLKNKKEYALALKNDPSSRKRCTLDRRKKDVILLEMIGDQLILVKLRGDKNRHYWTLLDTRGNIQPLPNNMKEILEHKEWTTL